MPSQDTCATRSQIDADIGYKDVCMHIASVEMQECVRTMNAEVQ